MQMRKWILNIIYKLDKELTTVRLVVSYNMWQSDRLSFRQTCGQTLRQANQGS